jgi:WD40 repeat protein
VSEHATVRDGVRGDLRCSVVQVLDGRGECAGTGFLLDGGLVASCAHVITGNSRGDGVPPTGPVMVRFPYLGAQSWLAEVIAEWWRGPTQGNVAFLRLAGTLPERAQPLRLAERAITGRRVNIFGFPRHAPAGGIYGYAVVGDRLPSDIGQPWVQLREATEITEGFSGAPAVDERTGLVVGMVDAVAPPDRGGRTAKTAHLVPAEQLRILCPALPAAGVCPYRGLAHFTSEDTAWFFGRDHAVEVILDRMRLDGTPRLLVLLGPSGSGKTSLVQAGVLPALTAGALPGSHRWAVITARPGSDPFVEFERAGLVGARRGLAGAVGGWLAGHPDRDRLVLVVDQFEELFGAAISGAERRRLLDQLADLMDRQPQATVLLVMRDEFYSQLAANAPRILEQQPVNMPTTLSRDELVAIITEPAGQAGVAIEPGLVDDIVGDAVRSGPAGTAGDGESDAAPVTVLPLAELALTELWEARTDGELTRERYQQIGGLTGALAGRCDRVFSELADHQRTVARQLLVELVEHPQDMHSELPLTRRRRRRSELPSALRGDPWLGEVAEVLADRGLLSTGRDPGSGEPTYELIHDSLLRYWGRLREWLNGDQEFRAWRARLEVSCREWAESDHDLEHMLRRRTLEDARHQLDQRRGDLPDHLVRYIEDSAREDGRRQDRDRRRLRFLARLLVAALVLLALLVGTGISAVHRAQQKARVAESQRLAATANLLQDRQPEQALLLSLQAVGTANTREALTSLASRLSRPWYARTALAGHTGPIWSVAFSRDGKLLATTGNDRTVRLWDMSSAQPLGPPMAGHTGPIWSVAFSPDSKLLATASEDGTVRLWDVSSRQPLGEPLTSHTGPVFSVVFSPDGKMLAVTGNDGTVRLWDVSSDQPLGQPLIGHTGPVFSAAFSPDGKVLATGSADRTVRLWDVGSRQPLGPPLIGHTDDIRSVTFSPNGKVLATTGNDRTVRLWDVGFRQLLGPPLTGHTGPVWSVAFGPDSKLLATASEDAAVRLWDVDSHQPLGPPLTGHTGPVRSVVFSPDGKVLATTGNDRMVRLWDVSSRQLLGEPLTGHTGPVFSAAFSPDGKVLATGSFDKTVRLWDVGSRQPFGPPLTGHTNFVRSVVFSPDGKMLATTSDDRTVRLWDVDSRQPLGPPLTGHTDMVWSAAFSPDGKLLATGSFDGAVRLWDVGSRELLGPPLTGHTNFVRSVVFSPDGKVLATASDDGTVRLWDVGSRQPLGPPLTGHTDAVWSAAFSPDGKVLATGSFDGTVRLWNVGSHQLLGPPLSHADAVESVAFSPDGKLLATGSFDKTVRLWDMSSHQRLGELAGHTGEVFSVVFSPDGQLLATASADQTVRLWALPETWVDHACQLVGRNLSQDEWNELIDASRPYVRQCGQLPSGPGAPPDAPVANYPALLHRP